MRRTLVLLSATLMVACAKAADNASVQQAGSTNDPAAVRAAIDSQLTRFRDGMLKSDTAAMAAIFTDDAMVFAPGAPLSHGRAAINKANADMFANATVTAFKLTTTDVIVTGDYAIETGAYDMTVKPKAGKAESDVGKYVTVWHKQPDGSWKIIRDIFNTDKPTM
jgi:uncharacterized protein (TIGR02246 family)